MLFGLKKILGALLMPVPLVVFGLLGALLLLGRGWVRSGRCMLIGVIVLFYLSAIFPVANGLAGALEEAYPKYEGQAVEAVIVLGGYHRSDQRRPVSALLSSVSMVRLSEGMRIHRLNPGSTLNLSGYAGNDTISNAEAMARVAQAYGVDASAIHTESSPRDTAEEAQVWSDKLKGQRVALVTSATHMPRAMMLFREAGLEPFPAPTNYRSSQTELTYWKSWVPSATALETTRVAWYEYVGLLWTYLRAL